MSTTKQVTEIEEKYKVLVNWIASSNYWDRTPSVLNEMTKVVDDFDYEVPQEHHEIKILTRIIDDIRNNDPSKPYE